jgi:transposase
MERLERKTIKGHVYYYYSKWARVEGKPRRLWQKYLGKLDDIVQAVQGGGKEPLCAEIFEWGLPEALWRECCRADLVPLVNRQCGPRSRGLSTGEYLAIAALNRAIRPHSKRSLWQWFSQTVLLRHFPKASPKRVTSQRFWDHMERIQASDVLAIWQSVLERLLQREDLDLSSICYDGTNYYTFISTFNSHCDLARRGKNKQGRDNLRQVSYALFCCADGQVPLYFDVYEGNRNDSKQFPVLLNQFHQFLQRLAGPARLPETTLIFDKGNNSAANFAQLDQLQVFFVGSVKLDEHKELLQVANDDPRFIACAAVPGTKAFRVTKKVYGRERTLLVTYNQNLFNAQWQTLQNDMAKASEKLSALQQRLDERAQGLIKGGKTPTSTSVQEQCAQIRKRQHLKKVITVSVMPGSNGVPRLQYGVDAAALQTLANTYLGKTLLISNRSAWLDEQIIKAYRSQFLIEDVFRESKDRRRGSWWPMHHWTDSKIRVHDLYCSLAQLLRALLLRRVRQAGVQVSLKRLLEELGSIREVINIYPSKRGEKTLPQHTVLSRRSKLQSRLTAILGLEEAKAVS